MWKDPPKPPSISEAGEGLPRKILDFIIRDFSSKALDGFPMNPELGERAVTELLDRGILRIYSDGEGTWMTIWDGEKYVNV